MASLRTTGIFLGTEIMLKPEKRIGLWGQYSLCIGLVIVLFMLGILVSVSGRNKDFVKNELAARGRSYFENMVLTRRWNAIHSGVFVEKLGDMQSNPYLENPDITTVDGKVYTKKNPALMTREMSEMAAKTMGYSFHITSLRPMNPQNGPKPFEVAMLKSFEEGEPEAVSMVEKDGKTLFRFMAPLRIEKSCLSCHARQGYQIGDVCGGISVSFDVSRVERRFLRGNLYLFLFACGIVIVLLALLHLLTRKFKIKLQQTQQAVEQLAITDELTGLYNRRYFFDRLGEELTRSSRYGSELSLIMMDIDYFKSVNDTYGHLSGDLLLHDVSELLKKNARGSDLLARFGGEEFVILLPETPLAGARSLAEKLCDSMAHTVFATDTGKELSITASFGCTAISPGKGTEKDDATRLVSMADKALYEAKAKGRNRVVVFV